MVVIGCSKGLHLAQKIARKLGDEYSKLIVKKFPDNELYVKFGTNLGNKNVVFVQSFYENINDLLVEVLFAAHYARALGAKELTLVAPYFPYLRQDKSFKKGEVASIEVLAGLISRAFDKIYVIDPHLHRKKKLTDIFAIKAYALSARQLIADYIKRHYRNAIIIGPDEESYKWAEKSAKLIGYDSVILRKRRFSAFQVAIKARKRIDIGRRAAVIVDDIVSTGNTLIETVRLLKKLRAEKIACICIHGIFVNNALMKIRNLGAKVISCNTIPSGVAKIDVTPLIAEKLIVK